MSEQGPWYWCLKHERVEPKEGCKAADRLGPFDTRAQAENWQSTFAARNEAWDREDAEER